MIDPVAIQLGPISIRWYAICIVTGLVLAVYLAMKEAPCRKIIPDDILDFILVAFPVAIVGARLYYVAFKWDYYDKNLIKIIDFWNGGIAGIAIYGGLIAGAIVLYFFCRRRLIHRRFSRYRSTKCDDCSEYWALGKFCQPQGLRCGS